MKILRVSNSLSPEKVGGIGVHVDEMSKKQGRMGHDVTVLTSDNGDRSLPRQEDREAYSVIRCREVARPVDNSIIPGIITALQRNISDYDLIHAHSYLYFSTNIAAIFSRVYDVPMALTHHGLFPSSAPDVLKNLYIPTVGKFTFESADRVFCYTQSALKELNEYNINAEKQVIHNGIDCQRFRPKPTDRSGSGLQLLFVGRVKRGKGIELLLKAFQSIKHDYPELRLKIVGTGSLLSTLQREYDGDRIDYTGDLSYEEMPSTYQQSDLLVLPTATEAAIPRVVMEAWACEIPAIMTNLPGTDRSKIEEGGLSLSNRTVNEVETAIRTLVENESIREKKGKRGREIVTEEFSWDETVNLTTKHLCQISENGR